MGVMIQTAILVTAILVVRKLAGEKLHAYIRYGLWLIVVLRLLIPVNFMDSPFSLLCVADAVAERCMMVVGGDGRFNENLIGNGSDLLCENMQSAQKPGEYFGNNTALTKQVNSGEPDTVLEKKQSEANSALPQMSQPAAMLRLSAQNARVNPSDIVKRITRYFNIVWIVGSLTLGGFFCTAYVRFRKQLYQTRKRCQAGAFKIPVYQVENLESPCLVGVLHPAVYIGSEIEPGTDHFRYAVTHEQVHYLHKDHIWAFVRVVSVVVYWFHPFVWIAAAASVRDGEIACDYGTVQRLGDRERLAYGEMLLRLSCACKSRKLYSCGTMLRPGSSEMKERILRLAGGNSSKIGTGVLALSVMLVLAGCAFTGVSAQSAQDETIIQNTYGTHSSGVSAQPVRDELADGTMQSAEHEGALSDDLPEPRQLTAAPAAVSGDTQLGADGPWLDYAGEGIVILHDYFGLLVCDIQTGKILHSLDLAAIGCNMTQGDDACQVLVSADGKTVWMHPRKQRDMFRYEIENDKLYQVSIVKTFELDLEGEDLFDRYLVTEQPHDGWCSNYLFEDNNTYIFLYIPSGSDLILRNLTCLWGNDAYALWTEEEVEFPLRYDGVVEPVQIKYDVPCSYTRISDVFGSRVHPVTKEVRVHEGIDFAAEEGTKIKAAADGIVYAEGYSSEYGNYVVVLHRNGEMTYYCHCQAVLVAKNDEVGQGDTIATVGSTGKSTGAHLHFALSRDGVFVDPAECMNIDGL